MYSEATVAEDGAHCVRELWCPVPGGLRDQAARQQERRQEDLRL